jgi:hypothetical protein
LQDFVNRVCRPSRQEPWRGAAIDRFHALGDVTAAGSRRNASLKADHPAWEGSPPAALLRRATGQCAGARLHSGVEKFSLSD